ncbi:MAG: sel1 repeat family protein [Candidatus Competibacteraceae bacterium]|nr:sel1 repeat family protein [Candidatus Competibacteraceae bacterium]
MSCQPRALLLGSLLLLGGCDEQQGQYRLAMKHLFQRDYPAGAALLATLSDNGHAPAQFRLGFLYRLGFGVPRNPRLAIYWFEKAARQGEVGGQYWLAESYRRGEGVPASPELAFQWFQRLAERGYAPAQYQVALAYADGLGIAKNESSAVGWLRKAVAGGHADAARRLARAYRHGELGLRPTRTKPPSGSARASRRAFKTRPLAPALGQIAPLGRAALHHLELDPAIQRIPGVVGSRSDQRLLGTHPVGDGSVAQGRRVGFELGLDPFGPQGGQTFVDRLGTGAAGMADDF